MITAWTRDELARIGAAEEVQVAPLGRDGTLRKPVTVWLVRDRDDLYIRSAVRGRNAAWFRGVQETRQGRIWAGRIEKDVNFGDAQPVVYVHVDAACRANHAPLAFRILDR